MSNHLAKIQLVNVREGWASEDGDFTPWLAVNISELGRALGLEFTGARTEERLYGGSRRVDIVAACEGRPVVIENQLEDTDNDHLSRLLIYAAGKDAKTVIWVAAGMDDEHWQVMHWLNRQNGNAKFYGVVVELLKIGDSKPAPYFKVVVAPGDMREQNTGRQSDQTLHKYAHNLVFSQELAERLSRERGFTVAELYGSHNYVALAYSQVPGVRYALDWNDTQIALSFQLHTDTGERDLQWCQSLYDGLVKSSDDIQSAIEPDDGDWFKWIRQWQGKRGSTSELWRNGNIYGNPESWGEYQDWIISKFFKFYEVFEPRLEELLAQIEDPPEVAE